MQKITIEFQDNDTTPDRLRRLAEELSIPVDMLIIRAIDAQLGEFGLEPIPDGFKPKNVLELTQARGLVSTVRFKKSALPRLSPERLAELKALAARPDSEIDTSDIAPLDEQFWAQAKPIAAS